MIGHFLPALLLLGTSAAAAAKTCFKDYPCSGPSEQSFPGAWDSNNFSPASRNVAPAQIKDQDHNVLSSWPGPAELSSNGSMLVFDFGKEVGGIVSVGYTACGSGTLGLSFSEASNFTGYTSDESNGGSGPDGALTVAVAPATCGAAGQYTTPEAQQRGGFRYLTLFAMSSGPIDINITSIEVEISFAPTWANLRAYGGYFHSSDEVLNSIWYASTYTVQTNTIPSDDARQYPLLNTGWANNASLGTDSGYSAIVDGAKRDRAIWAGDLGVATRSVLIGTGDQQSIMNALQVQYAYQASTGELPMVGPPISFFGSDTYHMSTIIGTYDYLLFSGDTDFLSQNWAGYQNAMAFVIAKIDSSGMMNVTGSSNWGRTALSNGHTTDGNMLLYNCLMTGAIVATWQSNETLASQWTSLAETLKAAVNSNNWDAAEGAFQNVDTDATVFPEDGNSFALYYNGSSSPSVAADTSAFLQSQWGPVGAITQELPGNVVPYIESLEIKGHLVARQPQRALDLMRLSWGWYLASPYGTGSTMLEGYFTDGSFRYRDAGYNKGGAYTSHAHGWSTGPTDALTSYVVGLRPTGMGGQTWVLEPQLGDLTNAQGGFTVPLGKFSARWTLNGSKGYTVAYNVPAATNGTLVLPTAADGSSPKKVTVDCVEAEYVFDGEMMVATVAAEGGKHEVKVVY